MTRSHSGRRRAGIVGAVLALIAIQLPLGAGPAAADASQISFVTASPVQTAFGGNWNVQIATRYASYPDVPVPPSQATVEVYLSGREGAFASNLPIQPDGSVYVSQSAASTLPPGEYQMTAALVPVAGGFMTGSQTTTPLVLQITSYAVDADIAIDQASVAGGRPVIEASLSGQFVETTGSVPAGTWAFEVTRGTTTVLETEVAQDAGATEALRYEITEKLATGTDYAVNATFTPIDSLAAGLEVTQPSAASFHTPGGGLDDLVPYPLWLLILTCLVPLGLAAAVVVLSVRLSGRRAAPVGVPQDAPELVHTPAEPAWDPFATAGPAAPAPTRALPAEPVQPTQVLPREPGEFTQLITPPLQPQNPGQPQNPQNPVQPPQDAPTENWSLSQEHPDDPENQHLR
jgi:hypothetical protein